jgi:hypothetical protein
MGRAAHFLLFYLFELKILLLTKRSILSSACLMFPNIYEYEKELAQVMIVHEHLCGVELVLLLRCARR